MLWDRGFWDAGENGGVRENVEEGRPEIQRWTATKLHGSWVLVRMKKWSGSRVNWLLIKHRDGYAIEGDADALLAEDRSVASGRSMAEIAAGTGRKPKPFITKGAATGGKTVARDAVWDSKAGLTAGGAKGAEAGEPGPAAKPVSKAPRAARRVPAIVTARSPREIARTKG